LTGEDSLQSTRHRNPASGVLYASIDTLADAIFVVNALTKALPQASAVGSEIQQINNLVQIGVKASEAAVEEETILDVAI
jgi:hypothetical protein